MDRRWEGGQATVELALIVPILLLLLIGIIDLGRVMGTYVLISNGSREGVQYAARHPKTPVSGVKGYVVSHTAPLDGQQVTSKAVVEYSNDNGGTWISWPSAAPAQGTFVGGTTLVHVSVTYSWSAVSFLVGQFVRSGDFTTRATAVMESSN